MHRQERHARIAIFLEQEMTDADRNPQPTLDVGSGPASSLSAPRPPGRAQRTPAARKTRRTEAEYVGHYKRGALCAAGPCISRERSTLRARSNPERPARSFKRARSKRLAAQAAPPWISGLRASPRLTGQGLQDGAPPHVLRSNLVGRVSPVHALGDDRSPRPHQRARGRIHGQEFAVDDLADLPLAALWKSFTVGRNWTSVLAFRVRRKRSRARTICAAPCYMRSATNARSGPRSIG
jgi:hypothetical protein